MRALGALGCVLLALLLAGCGSDDEPRAPVTWEGEPLAVVHPEVPGDDLVTGRIRNDTDHDLVLDAPHARVLDARGRRVRATVSYAAGYTHDLYPPADGPKENPRFARERTGEAATIHPGETHPLTIAWHRRDGRPVRVDLGGLSLRIPVRAGPRT